MLRDLGLYRDGGWTEHGLRPALVEALYLAPGALIAAQVAGALFGTFVAAVSGDAWLWAIVAVMTAVGAWRVRTVLGFRRRRRAGAGFVAERWEWRFAATGLLTAGATGLFAALTLLRAEGETLHLLVTCSATAYAAGVTSTSASRPRLAVAQLALTLLPFALALTVGPMRHGWVVATLLLFLFFAMIGVTKRTYRIILASLREVEDKARLAEGFERLASTDALTGLANRPVLEAELDRRLAGLAAEGGALAVCWLDLDRFKEFNDAHGHPAGDRLLADAAARLRAAVGADGLAARFGGDEFVALLPVADRDDARARADSLVRAMSGGAVTSASIGVAVAPGDGTEAGALLTAADVALYRAKADGRRCVRLYEPALHQAQRARRELEEALAGAVEREELRVVYQPIVSLFTGRVLSCEALLRWDHPTLGAVGPAVFVPLAEELRLMEPITRFVLGRAMADAARWPAEVSVAVNISPSTLRCAAFARELLDGAGADPRRLELEVTESVLLEADDATRAAIAELRAAGVRLALDDFGTGYASLASLRDHGFDRIKIDRSFLADVGTDADARAITEAVVALAQRLGLETVAEGIETEEQRLYAAAIGCASAQGWLFARPMRADALTALLAPAPRRERAA